ncbi:MAG: maleylpyruvate isomerase family protein [Actinomycetia bacterium]|nr:maleylpyruvate isomerase family protein [Actinomycetes bacterium]
MAERPLRQFYEHDMEFRAPGTPAELVKPWVRHRRRFQASLELLSDEQWRATTRCDDWNAMDVVWHLVTADQFWQMSIASGTAGTPTAFLAGFDPAATPGQVAAAAAKDTTAETMAAFAAVNDSFIATVEAVSDDAWDRMAESPLGHVPAQLALAHAFWDSWLHERDVLLPLELEPAVEPDELWCATTYSLFAAALQGGLPHDDQPVGPGPEGDITERVTFDEFPERCLEVSIGDDVTVTEVDDGAPSVGSALALVEAFTGRVEADGFALPGKLGAQLERARLIL